MYPLKFEDILRRAIAKYIERINKRREDAKKRALKTYQWEVPESREYNEAANQVVPETMNHALIPFIQQKKASTPEQHFEAFLEDYTESIDWWYKNGDSGKQHYAISYTNVDGDKALFYVDFVIRMKNGQIFLFDTKSEDSDKNAICKHNALIDYIHNEENADKHLKGGIIIQTSNGENWRYCPIKIKNSTDITGWDSFHPNEYKA